MKPLIERPMRRNIDLRLHTYGVTAALGLFTLGGVAPQCAPAPAPAPAIVQVSNVQDSVVSDVNHHRTLAGLGPVVVDGRLTAAAQGHSDHMAREKVMTHTGSGSTTGGQRITNAGYEWTMWAENVAAGQTTSAEVMNAWINSPGHRANILHGAALHIGVAAAKGADGLTYWTMVVAAR